MTGAAGEVCRVLGNGVQLPREFNNSLRTGVDFDQS